jgi:hypothetical protein
VWGKPEDAAETVVKSNGVNAKNIIEFIYTYLSE